MLIGIKRALTDSRGRRIVARLYRAAKGVRLLLLQLDELIPLLERREEQRFSEEPNWASDSGLTRLAATQALVARTYERSFNWSGMVGAMREEPDYQAAWANSPLITVRIATYNKSSTLLDRSLASVLRQTYSNWEAIVVGDCCTDDTEQRLSALGHERVRFENLPFRGPYPADPTSFWHTAGLYPMNRGLELAQGQWIAAIDDDDEWDDDHLEVLLAEAMRSRAEIVYGQFRMVDADAARLIDHSFGGIYPPTTGAVGFQAALCHGKLARFRFDPNGYLAGEAGDRNLMRRLWEAGVRFSALPRPVVTYWFEPQTAWGRKHLHRVREQYGYTDSDEPAGRRR
jgi:hypothetical protein